MEIHENGAYTLIDQAKEMVRLSEGMGSERVIKDEPAKRTLDTLRLFKRLMGAYRVAEVCSVATAAVREAANGKEFMRTVFEETGIEFQVISGLKEAYYDYIGVVNTIGHDTFYMVDTGGASTEVAYVENRVLKESFSIPYGAVNITELLLKKKMTKKNLATARDHIEGILDSLPWVMERGIPVVGLGGTIRSLAKYDKAVQGIPLNTIHHYTLTRANYDTFMGRIHNTINTEQIKALPGVNKSRADILLGGLLPLECIMERVNAKSLVISGNGLKEGLFYETFWLPRTGTRIVDNVLQHSIENAMKLYRVNLKHAYQVTDLALTMFDGLASRFDLGGKDRRILSTAGLLHDIGMAVEYYYHHYHGFYLTLNARLTGLELREQVMVAFCVGNHRDSKLKIDWTQYSTLINKKDMQKIEVMSMLLKIAEKLDRSESGVIQQLKVDVDDVARTVTLTLISNDDVELERYASSKLAEGFEKLFKYGLNIVVDSAL